ncbi:MAG: FtsH protease regulator HflK [archaeon ADurb.Bin336]|jgi:regulator of protease activity HflC (stomatin/prohibitin superfamily)|nr:MAG: FtsH protease regulator HflK [archaeon ADurb.Bin336]
MMGVLGIIFSFVIVMFVPLVLLIIFLAINSTKVINEYERGVKFTLGKYSGIMEPGLRMVLPIIQKWYKVDVRTTVIDVPKQDIMTKDNISAIVNAVVYYRVSDAKKAIIEIKDYKYAVSQLAQTTMREIIGETELDELLSQRDATAKKIEVILDEVTDPWGIKVESVELKEIILPSSLVRIISQEAEAEREKRAILLRAQGEMESSKNLRDAAKELTSIKGGVLLRTLQTIHSLSTDKSKTKVYVIPSELFNGEEKSGNLIKKLFK